jgi:flagellar biosynthesis protein FliR
MSFSQILKMGLPIVGLTLLADMVDGFPEQTIILLVWPARWFR